MSAAGDTAPAESLDERIARLKRELADAELDKAGDALASIAGDFLDLVPEYRVGDGPPATVEELEAATRFASEAWQRFTDWRTERAAEAAKRPYLALPAVQRSALPSGRSPAGAGSVYAAGSGFRWRLSRGGKLIGSRTWPTRTEAEIELAKALADPAFVPAPRDRTRLAGTGKHHCSKCGGADHRAPKCPTDVRSGSTAGEAAGRAAIETGADLDATMAAARAAATGSPDSRGALLGQLTAARVAPAMAERIADAELSVSGSGSRPKPTGEMAADPALSVPPLADLAADAQDGDAEEPTSTRQPLTADQQALVVQWIPMSHKVARKYSQFGSDQYGDVHAAAIEGLIAAAQTYDPAAGTSFQTWAWNRMTWAVCGALTRSHPMVTVSQRNRMRAAGLEPPPLVSSQAIPGFDTSIPDDQAVDSFEVASDSDLATRVAEASKSLPKRTQDVVAMYFSREMTLEAIGNSIGLTRERVRQVLEDGLTAIRAAVQSWSLPDPAGRQTCLRCKGEGGDCTTCKGDGYRWPEAEEPEIPERAVMPTGFNRAPSNDGSVVHPGRGWGPVADDGYATHYLCNGTGKIRIKKKVRDCFPCEGAGRRLCVRRATADERKTA